MRWPSDIGGKELACWEGKNHKDSKKSETALLHHWLLDTSIIPLLSICFCWVKMVENNHVPEQYIPTMTYHPLPNTWGWFSSYLSTILGIYLIHKLLIYRHLEWEAWDFYQWKYFPAEIIFLKLMFMWFSPSFFLFQLFLTLNQSRHCLNHWIRKINWPCKLTAILDIS